MNVWKNHLRKESLAQSQELLAERRDLFHHRRVEAFQDIRICLQSHDEEFLQFPIAALRCVVLELFRRPEKGPLKVGRGEVDAAPVGVGFVVVQPICARADDAPVDNQGFQIETARRRLSIRQPILEVLQNVQLLTRERRFEAVGKTDEKLILIAGWRARDDADGAAWMYEGVVCAPDFNEGNDLRSSKNVVGLMRHLSVPKFGDKMPIFRPNNNVWNRC